MKNSPHRLKHEQKKAIRQAQKEQAYEEEEKKPTKKQKKTYTSSSRKVKIVEGKAESEHKSHYTGAKEVDLGVDGESVHQEGEHWIRTVQKQTLNAASRIQKKLQKLPFLKRKK